MFSPIGDFRRAHPLIFTAILAVVTAIIGLVYAEAAAVPFMIGAVTLAEAANLSNNQRQRGVIETFINESPVLSRIPFMEIQGNAYQYNTEATLPGVAFRAVNAAYTESTGTVNPATEGLKIMGGDADVDRFIQRTRSNLQDQRAFQTALKAKAAAIKFTETFFEGDDSIDVNSFDGLRVRLVGNQSILAGANGATLTLDMIDDMIAAVAGGPDVIYMNDWLIRKMNRLVRATGGTVPEPREEYGRKWFSYAGIPVVDAGTGLDGTTRILGFDETAGASSLTSSMYAVKFGEEEFVSGLTNGGIEVYDLGELETKPAYRVRIEWYVGLGVFSGRAAARLRGILQS
jgi:hypothetical protein